MPRPKGSPNKTTQETREFLQHIIDGEQPKIKTALSELYNTNKLNYMQAIIKLLPFVTPKVSEVNVQASDLVFKAPSWFDTSEAS